MFSTIDSFDTRYSADSVEWCPIENFKDVVVCGTYQLKEKEQNDNTDHNNRLGKIYLFRIEYGRLNMLQELQGAAVLDMKWARVPIFNKILLAVVNAKGFLEIYELLFGWSPTLSLIKKIKVEESEEVLALSLDWSVGNESAYLHEVNIVVSTSTGNVNVFNLTFESLEKVRSIECHEYEAWITAFDYWDTNIIYTGGDDNKFKSYDIRVDTPVMNSRSHLAGVTSIHSNAGKQFSLATGSYDEQLRLWDTRKMGYPLSKRDLGGGIWRLKWSPLTGQYLLAACMYGGFRVIDGQDNSDPKILGEYNEHESISYGCDWSGLNTLEISERQIYPYVGKQVALVSTCSFYDHLMNLAVVELP